MTLQEKIQAHITDAMRGKDSLRLNTLRMMKSAVKNKEIKIIEEYLPAAASEDDIRRAIDEAVQETGATSMKDMGKVMKAALARLAGKTADGARVSQIVKEKLS